MIGSTRQTPVVTVLCEWLAVSFLKILVFFVYGSQIWDGWFLSRVPPDAAIKTMSPKIQRECDRTTKMCRN